MKCSCSVWFIYTTLIYFSCTVFLVQGKCSGRWAIHACYGGNGKRSGTDMSVNNVPERQRQFILRQLLLGNSPMVEDMELPDTFPRPPPEAVNTLENSQSLFDSTDEQIDSTASKASELNRVKSLLISMLLEKKYRDVEDEFY